MQNTSAAQAVAHGLLEDLTFALREFQLFDDFDSVLGSDVARVAGMALSDAELCNGAELFERVADPEGNTESEGLTIPWRDAVEATRADAADAFLAWRTDIVSTLAGRDELALALIRATFRATLGEECFA